MVKCYLLFVICNFIVLFHHGDTIKCFQCSSLRDPGCAELGVIYGATPGTSAVVTMNATADALKYYRECENTHEDRAPFCRKMSQTIFVRDKLEVVTRSCGWLAHPRLDCYDFENKGHAETVCQCFEDGCNTASSLQTSAIFSIFLTFLLSSF